MIPDFRVQPASPTGWSETQLTELKFMCGPDFHKPGKQLMKTVDKRADKLMEKYRKKAENMDRLLSPCAARQWVN